MTDSTSASCRSCGARTLQKILDLGPQPDPDWLLDPAGPDAAPEAPVLLAMCSTCGLAQLAGPRPVGPRPAHGHAVPAEANDPWVTLIERSMAGHDRLVVDVDGSSGLPADALAGGGEVVADLSQAETRPAGLILAGHALTHADDLEGLIGRMATVLAPGGLVAIDFHHALGLAQGEFDVLSHAHRSYLSLHSLEWSLHRHALSVVAAARTDAHGGTVRVLAARLGDALPLADEASEAPAIRDAERAARIDRPAGFAGLADRARIACDDLAAFLETARQTGRTVVGYGAAARGITLLNLAGIGVDRLSFIGDRAASKQHRLVPRARIPILPPAEIERAKPDVILILPWPLAGPITEQLAHARGWGARFVVAMPRLEVLQ